MQGNKLSIHIETGNNNYDNFDTGESIYSFFIVQKDYTEKVLPKNFQFLDNCEGCVMNYLMQIDDGYSDDALDMYTHKNSKFLFYQFNQYLAQTGKPLKLIRHAVLADDNYALTVIQEKN